MPAVVKFVQKTFPAANPTEGRFNLEASDDNLYDVYVYNIVGEEIMKTTKSQLTNFEIDLTSVPKGVYIIKCICDDKLLKGKIIVK